MKSMRIPISALFVALALIFSYIESFIQIGYPGVKLGLANLVILVALYSIGTKEAWIINTVRIVLAGLMFTGVSMMLYSLGGAICAMIVMSILKNRKTFSIIGVSIGGAAAHNFGQLLVAALMVENFAIFSIMPALMIMGLLSGIIIGIVANVLVVRINA